MLVCRRESDTGNNSRISTDFSDRTMFMARQPLASVLEWSAESCGPESNISFIHFSCAYYLITDPSFDISIQSH